MQHDVRRTKELPVGARMLVVPGHLAGEKLRAARPNFFVIAPCRDRRGGDGDEDALAAVFDRWEPFRFRGEGSRSNTVEIEFTLLVGTRRLEPGKANKGHHFAEPVYEYNTLYSI